MYEMTEEQRSTLLYILDHMTVTGPTQGGLLRNAADVVRSIKKKSVEDKKEGEG